MNRERERERETCHGKSMDEQRKRRSERRGERELLREWRLANAGSAEYSDSESESESEEGFVETIPPFTSV